MDKAVSRLAKTKERLHDECLCSFMQNSSEAIYCFEFESPVALDLPFEEFIDQVYQYAFVSEANDAWAQNVGFKTGDELIGMRLEECMPRSDSKNIETIRTLQAERFNVRDLQSNEVYSNGHKSIYLNNLSGIVKDGAIHRVWGVARDITEQKQLEEKLLLSTRDLQRLAGRLINRQEEELSRLSRELHDNLTQQLAVMAISAGALENNSELPDALKENVTAIKNQLIGISKEVHDLSRELHPSIVDDLGLERAVESECRNFSSRMSLPVIFSAKELPASIPSKISLALYRIVQEGLNNASKHAHSENVFVFLEGQKECITLTVRDAGIGFNQEKVREKEGLGLSSIRERVRLLKGSSAITTKEGSGTAIEVSVPLPVH